MQANKICGINVHPETDVQAQELVNYLQLEHCTWHVDADGVFTIHPTAGYTALDYMLAEIQAM